MIGQLVDVVFYTLFGAFCGFLGFNLGALRTGLGLAQFMPVGHVYRARGVRITRHDNGPEIEVGWIGRRSRVRRRPRGQSRAG